MTFAVESAAVETIAHCGSCSLLSWWALQIDAQRRREEHDRLMAKHRERIRQEREARMGRDGRPGRRDRPDRPDRPDRASRDHDQMMREVRVRCRWSPPVWACVSLKVNSHVCIYSRVRAWTAE